MTVAAAPGVEGSMDQSKLPGLQLGLPYSAPPTRPVSGPSGVPGLARTPLSCPHPSSLLFRMQNRALGP